MRSALLVFVLFYNLTYQNELCVFCFTSSGLARDDQALVDVLRLQAFVGGLCQGKHVRGQGPQLLAMILEHASLQENIRS
jgi:hypothetical protein